MNPDFSIVKTLLEGARLSVRRPGLLIVMVIVSALPGLILQPMMMDAMPKPDHLSQVSPDKMSDAKLAELNREVKEEEKAAMKEVVFSLVSFAVQLIVPALISGAILSVLKTALNEGSTVAAVRAGIRRYMWPLIILNLLISLIAVAVMIPFSLLISIVGIAGKSVSNVSYILGFFGVAAAILYLLFAKYALADPLVVVENMNPLAALGKSWRMTQGRLGYVIGCYVFVGTAEYLFTIACQHFSTARVFDWANAIEQFLGGFFSCYWIFLAWCMYLRIRDGASEDGALNAHLDRPAMG